METVTLYEHRFKHSEIIVSPIQCKKTQIRYISIDRQSFGGCDSLMLGNTNILTSDIIGLVAWYLVSSPDSFKTAILNHYAEQEHKAKLAYDQAQEAHAKAREQLASITNPTEQPISSNAERVADGAERKL